MGDEGRDRGKSVEGEESVKTTATPLWGAGGGPGDVDHVTSADSKKEQKHFSVASLRMSLRGRFVYELRFAI